MRGKNVLLLQVLFPNLEKEDNLYSELAKELLNQGCNVFVVTIQDFIGEKNIDKRTYVEKQQGIEILRVYTPTKYFNTNFIEKGITTLFIPFLYNKNIKKYFSNIDFDIIISISIIPGLYRTIKKVKKNNETKVYLLLRDMFPQMAQDMGVLPLPIFKYFRKQQIKLYNCADVIGCMSPKNINYVKDNLPQVDSKKLKLLPNWRTVNLNECNNSFNFRKKYNLNNKVIAIFGGVLGIQQGLDFLLELANQMIQYEQLVFLIIGNGTEKQKLRDICKQKKLHNVLIFDRIPSYEYESALKTCDIGLINLHGSLTVPHIPSKTLSYLEAGIPILAATDKNTDYGQLLMEMNAGLWCEYGDIDTYKNNMIALLDDTFRKELGNKGKEYLLKNLRTDLITKEIFNQLFNE